ncbi:uncharacterized protein LOC118344684 [Juglans regia]|uniref:Uncharacterized protein LOC118344684 n=1 Tax=Juglans regia TaxID=51240 RepID=A0A6P9EFS4_JUGRE|nr:uncharacterized protein LOC118344684 [Juglans regia]
MNVVMTIKNVVADLTKGEKLDETNYDMWHRKIQNLFNEQEVFENLSHLMIQPDEGNTSQHRRDMEAYQAWAKKDRCACFTMLSSMHNDLIGEFENYPTAQYMWNHLKITYEGTSTTRLRALALRFEQYVMDPKHTMTKHLRSISALIRNLKAPGNNLTDKQQVTPVIQSLPESTWGQMKLALTHSENIMTFADISRHLELEAEHIDVHRNILLVAQAGKRKAFRPKRKQHGRFARLATSLRPRDGKVAKCHRGKRAGKDMSKMNCYNFGKIGHFTRECTKAKKT